MQVRNRCLNPDFAITCSSFLTAKQDVWRTYFIELLGNLNEPMYVKPTQGVLRSQSNSTGGFGMCQMGDVRGTRTLVDDL